MNTKEIRTETIEIDYQGRRYRIGEPMLLSHMCSSAKPVLVHIKSISASGKFIKVDRYTDCSFSVHTLMSRGSSAWSGKYLTAIEK